VVRVKICGVTSVDQALECAELGVDAVGVNFVASSPRLIDEATARAIERAVGSRLLVVAVVAGMGIDAMRALRDRTGVGCLQLHGDEPNDRLVPLLPHAYKAVRVATAEDVALADEAPGEYVMVDAKVPGQLGGTGRTVDFALVAPLAKRRRLVLAGGLTPENVADAVAAVRPWCVDVASGVEASPGVKDMRKVREFVRAAKGG
jgi:phosphoribosylanthranilate isomerase